MSTSAPYASSLSLRVDQAKWEFGLPDGARRLIATGDFEGRNNETLVNWLASDELLSGRLLRWCNTPMYNLAAPYPSLAEVSQVMDRCELTRLAVLAFARGLFPEGYAVDGIQRDRLWGHSIAVGSVASMISRTCGCGDPSLVFVAGTLHDIGLCAHQRLAPEAHQRIVSEVDELSTTHEVEQDLHGWDHAQLGAAILGQWGMPAAIQAAALHHHAAEIAVENEHAETIGCVAVANFLCSRAGWSSLGYHNLEAPGESILDRLGINSGLLAVIWQQVGGSLQSSAQLY
jgi:putative nucleotidyltransferase with HDIG domain